MRLKGYGVSVCAGNMTEDAELTCHDRGREQQFSVMSLPQRQQRIDRDRTKRHTETRSQSLQAHLYRIGVVDVPIHNRDEVDQRIVIHSRHESNEEGQGHDTLPGKQFPRNHGHLCTLPFPNHESDNEGQPDQQGGQDVRTRPRMGVSAGRQSDQASRLSANARGLRETGETLQQRQARD